MVDFKPRNFFTNKHDGFGNISLIRGRIKKQLSVISELETIINKQLFLYEVATIIQIIV